MSINLKDTTYLLNNGFIMVTKKGTAWRCGKGYRKDWSKLIGKEVLLHGSSYTLTNRVKKEGKWYLVYTDGTNNYTELQSKALHNKNIAKDTIIAEAVKKELIDKIIEEVEQITNKHFNSHNKPSKYYHSFKSAVAFIKRNGRFYRDKLPGYYRELANCYHPDRHNTYLYQQPYTAEDYMSVIQTLKPQKRSERSNKPKQLLLPAPKELIDILVEQADTFVKFYNYNIYQNPANYTKKGTLRKSVKKNELMETWDNYLLGLDDVYYSRMVNSTKKLFNNKIWYLMDVCDLGWKSSKELYKQLIQYYHPDHYHKYFPTECFKAIQWLKRAI